MCLRTYSTFGDRAFGAAGPGLWNSLPSHLKDADISYSEFRRLLKTFLFGQWGHGTVWTVLTAPLRNIRTYLLTYCVQNKSHCHISNSFLCNFYASCMYIPVYTPWVRKQDTKLLFMSLPKIDRFFKFMSFTYVLNVNKRSDSAVMARVNVRRKSFESI